MALMKRSRKALMAALAALILTACAHPELMTPGMNEETVEDALGAPHAKVVLDDGSRRWVYSFQGLGQEVWWVTFDKDGRVTGHEQVLDREHFSLIKPGVSKKEDVWALFGKCAQESTFVLKNRTAWMYRFKEDNAFDMACWFEFDPSGTVVEVGYTIDPWEGDGDFFRLN